MGQVGVWSRGGFGGVEGAGDQTCSHSNPVNWTGESLGFITTILHCWIHTNFPRVRLQNLMRGNIN